MTRITIDPVTRLEGHGKIEILLDDAGDVEHTYFQIPELRGFESFCVGRPVEDMPALTNRICGVCPEAHHMAAAKAGESFVARFRKGQLPDEMPEKTVRAPDGEVMIGHLLKDAGLVGGTSEAPPSSWALATAASTSASCMAKASVIFWPEPGSITSSVSLVDGSTHWPLM